MSISLVCRSDEHSIIVAGIHRRRTKPLTETDRRVTFTARRRPLLSLPNDAILLKTGHGTKHPPPASADVLDGVLRSRLSATRRVRGRWLGNHNQAATVRRRAVYTLSTVVAAVCPAFRSINDAMHILRRCLAIIDHLRLAH